MTRRAYGFAVGLALAVGILAWVASYRYNLPLRDPDGVAGPSYVRLPLIVGLFYLADVVPRALIANRGFRNFRRAVKAYSKERWTGSRIALVVIGLLSFYVVYIAYRNLKGFLPFVRSGVHDPVLIKLDRALAFGHDPATVLHDVLGTGISAHVLSFVYAGFLLFVPLSLGAALVWSKNVATGFWYVTALCVNWVLGAASYYWVPSQGPYFANHKLFVDLPDTGVTQLQDALAAGRDNYLSDPGATDSVQSIAAFASLHVSIIFTAALIAHYVIPSRVVRYTMWIYFVLTAISTVYFGWHYLLDDIAGLAIGYIAVWVGAKTTGHQMRPQRDRAGGDGVIGVFPPESSKQAVGGTPAEPVPTEHDTEAAGRPDARVPAEEPEAEPVTVRAEPAAPSGPRATNGVRADEGTRSRGSGP
jgi:membrane-associated phospholipid phosphatase